MGVVGIGTADCKWAVLVGVEVGSERAALGAAAEEEVEVLDVDVGIVDDALDSVGGSAATADNYEEEDRVDT